MVQVFEAGLTAELYDVFEVTPVTRGTPLQPIVAADLVRVGPGKSSQVHRHNRAETVLVILEGSGFVRVGDEEFPVRSGARLLIGKGVYHGVRTEGEGLAFLSVQAPPILADAGEEPDLEPLEG